MQEYFKILGLPETATNEEIEAAYNKLKEKYSRERFYEGEIAMNMDPYNTKYSDSYTKLKQKMEFNENQFRSGNAGYAAGGGQQNAQYNGEQRQMGGGCGNDCLSFCATWCCLDMLCSMCCR